MEKVNLADQLGRFSEHWSPRIIGEVNGQQIKLAKLKGEFIWHHHEKEDEMFLVLKGRLVLQLRDGEVTLNEGELFTVPRGLEHRPVADDEVHVLLVEPASTVNTGNVRNHRTIEKVKTI